jgi:hypothetical protein
MKITKLGVAILPKNFISPIPRTKKSSGYMYIKKDMIHKAQRQKIMIFSRPIFWLSTKLKTKKIAISSNKNA